MTTLKFQPGKISKTDIADLHVALKKMKLNISENEINSKELGKSTVAAIKDIQKKNNLKADGKLTKETLNALNREITDAHYALNKTRTEKLQGLLEKLKLPVSKDEKNNRLLGDTTRKALESFQKKEGLPVDGKISDDLINKLNEAVIKQVYSTKTQVGKLQAAIQRAVKIAKLPVEISQADLKKKTLGVTTSAAIKAFQEKYKLPATGQLDKATLDKIQSVAVSRGVPAKILNKPAVADLRVISTPLKLNMKSPKVAELQKNLAHLGYKIEETEFKTQTYGKTTRAAVLDYQVKNGLPQTGHFEKATIKSINYAVITANPAASAALMKYRIRGSVRDELLQRKGNMVIRVYEKLLDGESAQPLITKKNHLNGFFDLPYAPPIDFLTGQVKEKFHLVVKLLDANDQLVDTQVHYNVTPIHWVNFNMGGTSYLGDNEYSVLMRTLTKALGNVKLSAVKETPDNRQVTHLSAETALTTDDIMRLLLSQLVADGINNNLLTQEVFYAFIRQNLPSSLPGNLLASANDWETIGQLTEMASNGIVFTGDDLLSHTLDNAVMQNLVGQAIKQDKTSILSEIQKLRNTFTLEKPILIGNGNLKSLLSTSAIQAQNYSTVADVFTASKGINDDFWKNLNAQSQVLGQQAIQDLQTVVDLGDISKNHQPTIQFLKSKTGSGKQFTDSSDLAKLDQSDWVNIIHDNGDQIPDYIPGTNLNDRVTAYSNVLKSRAEFIFPVVSLVASVKRSGTQSLQNINQVESFVDANNDFDFKLQNLDKYILDKNIQIDDKTREELKVVQRVHKLSPDSLTATALIEEGLHSSAQIYFTGRSRLTAKLKAKGVVDKNVAQIYEQAKMQYSLALSRLLQYRPELHFGNPQVIINQTYTKDEIKAALGDIPDLETLFGSLDYCECEHCQSLYGPAAYMTDMLRFLKEHDSLVQQNGNTLTVKDILFDRRPDLGNIKLNCENTDTPLPYIDLVCEILENNIDPKQTNFSYQTTLTADELRALPQYIRPYAYDTIAKSEYPMLPVLNLWQEESRVYLNYLRVPRYSLMMAFQDISNPMSKVPDDVSIAAEYFGISSQENQIIITSDESAVKQNVYWGFDTTQTSIPVSDFLQSSKLSYYELLDLLLVKFLNDPNSLSVIDRPPDSCDVDVQTVTNLSLHKFDLMHRFIRLWRITGWQMWELDLLLRNPKIGNNAIDGNTITNLMNFKLLQERLRLPNEILFTFFTDINTEQRVKSDHPATIIPALYVQLFQNPSINNPTDTHLALPLDSTILLELNTSGTYAGYNPVPTILSALAIKQTDFDLLNTKTNDHLSIASLSALVRYTYLAKGLKLSVKDFWLLLGILNLSDPFVTVKDTYNFIITFEKIRMSGLSLLELDYILNYNTDSPLGLREESIAQFIDDLRKIIAKNEGTLTDLGLDSTNENIILSFNADSLTPMTDPQVTTAIQPLLTALTGVHDSFVSGGFSVQETEYILNYNPANGFTKPTLIDKIKSLQTNVQKLLDQNENQIVSQVAGAFGFTDQRAGILIRNLVLPGQTKTLLEILSDKSVLDQNSDGTYKEINTANYPLHFKTYALLHKNSVLLRKIKIDDTNLEWFQLNDAAIHTLDLSALPVDTFVPPNAFDAWYAWYKFIDFGSNYPEPEDASLRGILDLAKNASSSKTDILAMISKFTQWDSTELSTLDARLNLKHQTGTLDYINPDTYIRLQMCFQQMKLTGVDAATMVSWAKRDDDTLQQDTALQTRLAIKSKYENEDWLQKITPLSDDLREKKRTALVNYLMEDSLRNQPPTVTVNSNEIPNPLYWKDTIDLFNYFLIDVEMSSCQLTSRIKQALSSIQLFVQRCFLNLENRYVQVTQEEKEDTVSENAWSQWKWMKNYRIWEANRKIFFYPENWLEPELRDDKSPFFEDLENELLQNEITNDNVEAAFANYLFKVDEVSNLEVCGLYHQMEELNPYELGYEVDIVHVIARTRSVPPVYYYRKYDMNYLTWSAWEKVDVDITGDQVMPVVYNRKLHLFWLAFTEKSQKTKKVPPAKPSNGPTDSPEAPKVIELQLGWSIHKDNGWTSKKISKQKIIHPWERPHYSYNLKPYYKSTVNELWIDIYLSTSREFNDGTFYDPYTDSMVKVTNNPFNENFLPWHSASFIFNGNVTEVKMKGLQASFHMEYDNLGSSVNSNNPLPTNSYDYVHNNFGEDGQVIKVFQPNEDGPRLALPAGMHFNTTKLSNNLFQSANASVLRVLENAVSIPLLNGAINPFELVYTQQDLQFNTFISNHPLFYQDSQRSFFIKPEWHQLLDKYGRFVSNTRKYRFYPSYHPYTQLFIRELNQFGIEGLFKRDVQVNPQNFVPVNTFNFNSYQPTGQTIADDTVQKDIVDFSFGGAYSIYNWELFFHAPLMIACRLSQNQQFEDAMNWFHYIFDPTNIDALPTPNRYWITKPFFEYNSDDYRKQRIENILSNLDLAENKGQLIAWRNNPFKPHLIARYRPVAYQKNVVMKYLDNLVAWGDQLFSRNTIESINEATLLYMLAYEILGKRPQKIPNVDHEEFTFNELEANLDSFGNALVDVQIEDTLIPIRVVPTVSGTEPMPKIETFYFCIPNNDNMLHYWDVVEDRLFKIRHCMNIQGMVQQLPLFEPPIDPALLVKAAAAGVDLSSVLNDISTPTPRYRFRTVAQKAIEFCNEVKSLGDKLLNALQNKDSEGLALLRSQNEIQLLEAIKDIKNKQVDDAVQTIGSLNKAKDLAQEKFNYYTSREFMTDGETAAAVLVGVSAGIETVGTVLDAISAFIVNVPDFYVGAAGFGGTPVAVTHIAGGSKIAAGLQAAARVSYQVSGILDKIQNIVATISGYGRRMDEWQFQGRLAAIEIDQVQFQINAAEIRQAIAEKDVENQQLQIDNSNAIDDYLRNKYTNQQLFNWMITRISSVYFQAYQLAYEMAKKAERCYQYELGIQNSSFIQFGYWDSLKKGLLSGDKLMYDLRRLESAYYDENARDLEITKNISLALMAPLGLITLKENGNCTISLPEWLFNMDYPGHYMRRIKSVSISIPCIAGPYTSINCTLSLVKNETRIDPTLSGGQYEKTDENDARFVTQFGSVSSIATSHAQRDSGLFELNFNDERFLPFEGAGVISDWQISMPLENNYFDFSTISDLILHINYTARDGGGQLAAAAQTQLTSILPDSAARLFSLKHEFPNEWYAFLNPAGGADQELVINLKPENFPFFLRSRINQLKIKKLELYLDTTHVGDFESLLKVTSLSYETSTSDLTPNTDFNGAYYTMRDYTSGSKPNALGEFRLKIKLKSDTDFKSLSPDVIDDLFLLSYVAQ